MLHHLIIAYAVWTHWRLLVPDTVKIPDQKWAVARPQLGDGDALASGPAESPVEQQSGVSSESAVGGRVRIT